MSKRRSVILLGATLAILGGGALLMLRPLRLRAILVAEKADGQMPDVDWSDLKWMVKPGSPVDLDTLRATKNPYMAIESPRKSPADIESGEKLFGANCAPCHGERAAGGPGGPSLHAHVFRRGQSDWALYQTITRGIPGTAMAGRNMPEDSVWRIISYLKRELVASGQESGIRATTAVASIRPVTASDLLASLSDSAEWLMYSGAYSGQRHSSLRQIDVSNVSKLRVAWARQFATSADKIETTPIVRGSVMFVTVPPNQAVALDATTGAVLWAHSWDLPPKLKLCCGQVNRGVAILGNRVFVGTLDGRLMALDANSGRELWQAAVADNALGYSITGAPLAIDNMVLTGVGGGEFGIRGFIDAYDASSGKRLWRTYTVPAPGEPGSETWQGESLLHGGAPTWLTGSYDPEARTVFWGVGNPSPNYNGENRKGDNLYANSVVALDVDSGKMRWHFQFTPHDTHDWDSVQIPVLLDAKIDGKPRKLMAWANRNGFYYLLDRTDGKFLLGTPFVKQTWTDGLDPNGRPRVRPESVPSREGSVVYPNLYGGTNWWSPAYDPSLGLLFVGTTDRGGIFYVSSQEASDEGFLLEGLHSRLPNEDTSVAIKAIDVMTGQVKWQHLRPPAKSLDTLGGLLSTNGSLVFEGERECFFALDSRNGTQLWNFNPGGQIVAAPVTYEVNGIQFVAVAAGRSIFAFALPNSERGRTGQNSSGSATALVARGQSAGADARHAE